VKFDAVLFDLFDTLVLFDRERMPLIEVKGRHVRSSAGLLHAVLRDHDVDVGLERCYEALIGSWQEAERRRAVDHREVGAHERFAHFFRALGLDPDGIAPALLQSLLDAHRGALAHAAELPPHHRPLLASLAARFRLAVVSNFDYSPTAHEILDRAGVTGLFRVIVVSDEVGWRKPRPEIFEAALGRLEVTATDALFVGDRADIDVVGAQRLGMPVAWINREQEPLPAGVEAPDFEIRDLAELAGILDL
jgi:FMN phosphatase YigB (HAD superfamily)